MSVLLIPRRAISIPQKIKKKIAKKIEIMKRKTNLVAGAAFGNMEPALNPGHSAGQFHPTIPTLPIFSIFAQNSAPAGVGGSGM